MMIYVVILVVCLTFAIMELAAPKSSPRYTGAHLYFFLSLSLCLFLIAGFRECGYDFFNYSIYFEALQSKDWLMIGLSMGSEPGYSLINYLLGNYAAVICTVTLLLIFLQFSFIYKYSKLPFFALFLYVGIFFLGSSMGQYRQALAIGVVLWAVVNRDNKFKFFALLFCATMFHFSAVIGIFTLLVPSHIKSIKWYITLIAVALICSVTAQIVYPYFISTMPSFIAMKLEVYAAIETTALGINATVLLRLFIFIIVLYYKQCFTNDKDSAVFFNLYFVSLLIYIAFGFAPQVASRGTVYLAFFEIIIISNLIYYLKRNAKVIFLCIFIVFTGYRYFSFISGAEDAYIPYKNWLFNLFI